MFSPTSDDLFSRRINAKPFEAFYPKPIPAYVCYSVADLVRQTSADERFQWLNGLYEWARLIVDQKWACGALQALLSAWESLNEEDTFLTGDFPYQPFSKFSRGELASIFMDRFFNRHDLWGKQYVGWEGKAGYACQKPDMDTRGGKYLYEPVTLDLVTRHFRGEVTCGTYAIDEHNCSRWLCFDSDTEDGSMDRLEAALMSWGFHVIRESRRPGRAGHLWVLFDEPVQAERLIILGNAMIKLVGAQLMSKSFPKGMERFPKDSANLSLVRAPLGINLKPEAKAARGWFDGIAHDLTTQLEWLAEQPLNRAADAVREAERYRKVIKPTVKAHLKHSGPVGKHDRIHILDHVAYTRKGSEYVARCPACAAVGEDTHEDNLRVTLDGQLFTCVEGGPGVVHKSAEIVRAALRKGKMVH